MSGQAEQYADLFATPGGYFASGPRGEVREREDLIEMTMGYDRCKPGLRRRSRGTQPRPGGRARRLPAPVIEAAPEGAKAHIINSRGGGYYDDVYVKTPKGWRFKSRKVISDDEVAAGTRSRTSSRSGELAGDDHGHYEDLYGRRTGDISPRDAGADSRPFRTSGSELRSPRTASPDSPTCATTAAATRTCT